MKAPPGRGLARAGRGGGLCRPPRRAGLGQPTAAGCPAAGARVRCEDPLFMERGLGCSRLASEEKSRLQNKEHWRALKTPRTLATAVLQRLQQPRGGTFCRSCPRSWQNMICCSSCAAPGISAEPG